MSIVDTKARTSKYPHHKQIIFAFFVVAQTTMFSKRNWNCYSLIIREVVFLREGDNGIKGEEEHEECDEDDEDDGEK